MSGGQYDQNLMIWIIVFKANVMYHHIVISAKKNVFMIYIFDAIEIS